MDPWKRRFLLETIISRFHVIFLGCNWLFEPINMNWEQVRDEDYSTPYIHDISHKVIVSAPKSSK